MKLKKIIINVLFVFVTIVTCVSFSALVNGDKWIWSNGNWVIPVALVIGFVLYLISITDRS